jgi:hypothetical protein
MDLEDPHEELIKKSEFVEPQRGTKYGKRANWTFKTVKEVVSGSKLPEIRVLVRKTEKSVDDEVEEQCDGKTGGLTGKTMRLEQMPSMERMAMTKNSTTMKMTQTKTATFLGTNKPPKEWPIRSAWPK